MTDSAINIHVQGDGAEEVAQELSDLITDIYDTKPAVNNNASSANAGETRKIDPATGIALAGLVLSIPSAIMAALDLADRIKKRKKAERLIQWARQKQQSTPQLQIHVEIGQAFLSLEKIDSAQLLDATRGKDDHSQR
jgi:predicted Zn-dependent peptidase